MDSAAKRAAAKKHIQKLRHSLDVDSDSPEDPDNPDRRNIELENVLKVLSRDLYSESTHFLLEILQNADDNDYKSDTPTLKLTFGEDSLRIDTNEKGFSDENVTAICSTGASSKTEDHDKTGEKGLGFKAVFRVADIVWILSPPYTFKFDKKKKLGMIAPEWVDDLPVPLLKDYSSIYLHLYNYKKTDLEEVMKLDKGLLPFLKRIQRIELHTNTGSTRVISRRKERISSRFYDLIIEEEGEGDRTEVVRYKVIEHNITNMPADERRPRIDECVISLGFPVSGFENLEKPSPQPVYAYLPIDKFGFAFALQSDFVLIANRGNVDSSSDWNLKIRDCIASSFSDAVDYFITTPFRYTWPKFLPLSTERFFEPVAGEIQEKLKGKAILEGEDGQMHEPSSLQYVGDKYKLIDEPLILTDLTIPRYLSRHYKNVGKEIFEKLDVKELDFTTFLCDLDDLITRPESEFYNKSPDWYSKLYHTLWYNSYSGKDKIPFMKLIPLKSDDGTSEAKWTSGAESKEKLFYLPKDSTQLVPKGTEVMFVHEDIGDYQRFLFSELGAQDFSDIKIAPFVVSLHKSLSSTPTISTNELMEHLVFLFRSGWRNQDNADLWVVTTTGPCHASEAYLRTFEQDGQRFNFPVLHEDYSVILAGDEKGWVSWLKEQLDVYEVPRLVQNRGEGFELSEDMKVVMEILPSGEFLRLLRDHWDDVYSKWLGSDSEDDSDVGPVENEAWNSSKATLKKYIMTRAVKCHGGVGPFPLNTTTLPTEGLLDIDGSDSLRLLDIPNPSDSSWSFLEQLGVKTEIDSNEYLKCLISLKEKGRPMKSLSLYDKIQKHMTDDETVQKAFKEHSLIYIPSRGKNPHHWAAMSECVWRGPRLLKRHYCLSNFYSGRPKLFTQVLDIKDADLETFVSEARSISSGDQPDYILRVLEKINDLLDKSADDSAELVQSLRNCAIFPVRSGDSDQPTLLSLAEDWFVVDDDRLARRFRGKVPLLVWPKEHLRYMDTLIRILEIDKRFLSENVKRKARIVGTSVQLKEQTNTLRERARYIACYNELINASQSLIPPGRIWLWSRLRDANVYGVDKILIDLNMTVSGNNVKAVTRLSPTITIDEDESLSIYLETRDISNDNFWLIELSEPLSAYFGIPQNATRELCAILTWSEPKLIEGFLIRHDITILDIATLENYAKYADRAPPFSYGLFPRTLKESETEPETIGESIEDEDLVLEKKHSDNLTKESRSKRISSPSTSMKPTVTEGPRKQIESSSDQNENQPKEHTSSAIPQENVDPKLNRILPLREIAQSISIMMKQERPDEAIGYTPTLNSLHPSQPETPFSHPDPLPLTHVDILSRMPMADIASEISAQIVANAKAGAKKPEYRFILDRALERSEGLRLAGLNNIIYLPSPDDLPDVDFDTITIRGVQNLPARYQINRENEERILYIALNSSNTVDFEPTLLGEVKISQWLEDLLGDAYKPDRHWTSPMRSQLKYDIFKEPTKPTATFTLDGNTSPLTKFLIKNSYRQAELWLNQKPRYHIEVQTTIGGLDSKFSLNAAKVDLAREHTITKMTLKDVFILIRIYDIHTDPGISFFVDPWEMYSVGRLKFQAKSEFSGNAVKPHISFTERIQQNGYAPIKLTSSLQGPLKTPQANSGASHPKRVMYTWSPLEKDRDIRLLLLSKGQRDMKLEGKLEQRSLDDHPEYFAMSYAWGSRLQQFTLKTDQGDIPLTMSLYLALRQIRKADEDIYIWADAICINQDDRKEKASQVTLMQDIFKSAIHVFGWLGPGDPESQLALETLRQIYELLDGENERKAPKSWGSNNIPPVEDPAWLAIKRLFDRKWFRRVWIVQEVILASKLILVCGDVQIRWEDFYQAAKYCDYSASDRRLALIFPQNGSQAAVVSLGDFRRLYNESGGTTRKSVYTLLGEFKRTESTNPCDKLFALLSLATDGNIEGFKPDYELELKDVVLKYTRVFIEEQGRGMELLHRARYSENSGLPSWVPSWTSSTAYPKTLSTWGGSEHFRAGSHQGVNIQISGDMLSVSGQIVDSLVKVGKSPSSSHVIQYLDEIFNFIEQTYPSEDEHHQTLKWKIPIGAAARPKTGDWGNDGGLASFKALEAYWKLEDPDNNSRRMINKIHSNAADPLPFSEAGRLAKTLSPYLNTVIDFAEIFSPAVACTTKAKCVGIVPQAASSGDVVAVFSGSTVPFLLRKHHRGDDHYQVIGECYIHGLMHGELQSQSMPQKNIYLV